MSEGREALPASDAVAWLRELDARWAPVHVVAAVACWHGTNPPARAVQFVVADAGAPGRAEPPVAEGYVASPSWSGLVKSVMVRAETWMGSEAPASAKAAEGARGSGGGLGAAVAEDRSRFVVMATAMATGGGVIGAVCVMVIWTVGIDAGTKVICGRVGIGEAGGVAGICWRDGPPCRSSFFCSSVAIRVLIKAMLCCVSSGLSMRSLW